MTATEGEGVAALIIDADAHVGEPADLWTSRLPKKWSAVMPRVEWDPTTGVERWRIGDEWLEPTCAYSQSGWRSWFPSIPPTIKDADPACFEPLARLERLDEFGIWAQVLHPNILGFNSYAVLAVDDPAFRLACVRAYNDFILEFASANPDRLIALAALPFWDIEASVNEMQRCVEAGHRGVLWAARFDEIGLPYFSDAHWDPVYGAAQALGIPMQLHAGFSAITAHTKPMPEVLDPSSYEPMRFAKQAGTAFVRQIDTIAEIVMSGLCERFPALAFVSVESGFGFIPFLMEMLDWQWQNFGGPAARHDRLLPSEYFRRQVHATFWFERQTLPALAYYPDNIMFSTDFPHPTSLTPGPNSTAARPDLHAADAIVSQLPSELSRRVLSENAARLYRIPLPSAKTPARR